MKLGNNCTRHHLITQANSLLFCGVVIVQCLFNIFYYVIWLLHTSATAKNYPKIQNILNEIYRIFQPPSTAEWMTSWFTTKLLSLILSLRVAGYLHLSQRDLFCLDVFSSSVSLSSTHTATPVTATYSTMISK